MARAKRSRIMNQLQEIDWSDFNPKDPNYKTRLRNALEHVRSNATLVELKDSVLSWYRKNDKSNYEGLEFIEDWRFHNIGRYFCLLGHGVELEKESTSWVNEKMQPILARAKTLAIEKREEINIIKFPSKEPTSEQFGHWLAQDLEELALGDELDEDNDAAYDLLRKKQPKPIILRFAIEKINEFIDELTSFTADEIEEGFKSEDSWRKSVESYRLLLQSLKNHTQNSKRKRKSGRKNVRVRRLEKVVGNVKFKAEDNTLKLVSIEPLRLLGAKTALVFNDKTRKIGIYYADTDGGFEIRGTTIHGFDSKKSTQKTLRKPAEQIESFRKVTARRAEIVFNDYIKAKAQPLTGRLNEHIMILQVWK